jgi:hypothetical protein
MPSIATGVFEKLDRDVDTLLGMHSGTGAPGRPAGNNGPLLRSAVVLLVTAWENYVEQVLLEVIDHVTPIVAADANLLSTHLRSAVATKAKESPWHVIGDSWLTDVARKRIEYEIRKFNTAATKQVNTLVDQVLGIESILDSVSWQGLGADKVQAYLDDLVLNIRGEIVHKGTPPGELDLGGVRNWRTFIGNLVRTFDVGLAKAVTTRYGSCCW